VPGPPASRPEEPAPEAARAPLLAHRFASAGLVVLLGLLSLCPDPGAALPRQTYFFRDFTVTFYPLRLFAARELRAGRLGLWNPFVYEGAFALPCLHPLDLLHVVWSSPVAVSWLLTLEFPLAALCAYALVRDLGAGRAGAFVAGAIYALGGLARSSLNLYVYLQALALAPLVVLALRRAAARGGRFIPGAALALALSFTTLAMEFVAQGVLLGIGLGLASAPWRSGSRRLAGALALGLLLGGVVLGPILGFLPETVRGAGLPLDVVLANETHPLTLLQALIPSLFGPPAGAVEVWWGGHFFSHGLPYFVSLYIGPLALALAFVGLRGLDERVRAVLILGAVLGAWYALGSRGGLAPLISSWRPLQAFRFPSKALLLPYLAVTILGGLGAQQLFAGRAWRRFGRACIALSSLAFAVAACVLIAPRTVAVFAAIEPRVFPSIGQAIAVASALVGLLALVGALVARAVARERLRAGMAALFVAVLLSGDLVVAGWGLNPQCPASFFDLVPELRAEHLDSLGGGRVFSYGLDYSPAFASFLAGRPARLGLPSFFANRQILAPYANMIDGVHSPEGKDLTGFVPRLAELWPADYDPRAAGQLLPWLRQAAVAKVLSLDPLDHPELHLRRIAPVGPPGLQIHVYDVDRPAPRAYLACRVVTVETVDEGLRAPFRPGFDLARDVALQEAHAASCREGIVDEVRLGSTEERYRVVSDARGFLVVRASFAAGFRATVDGEPAPVLRADGKHRAVEVGPGTHEVVMSYDPPGLRAGALASGLGLVACAGLLLARPRSR
jgi:hypothetical protein